MRSERNKMDAVFTDRFTQKSTHLSIIVHRALNSF